MPSHDRTITDAADMLAMLHEAPRRRAVVHAETDDRPHLCEYPGERIEETGRVLAMIALDGSAYDLLNDAIEADVLFDLPAWEAMPVRFNPRHGVVWVSPEHPEAASAPCVNGDRTEEMARWRGSIEGDRLVLTQIACAYPAAQVGPGAK